VGYGVSDVIQVADRFYILSTSSRVDDRTRVLKHGDTFAIFDRYGDMHPLGLGEHGLYHDGTRYLSRLELRVGDDAPPFLLSSTVREDNAMLAVDLANRDLTENGDLAVPADTIHIFRSAFLWQGALHHRVRVRSYCDRPLVVTLRLRFDADFVDIFEVRGTPRTRRGQRLPPRIAADEVVLGYRGLDGVLRCARLVFVPAAASVAEGEAVFRVELAPLDECALYLTASCELGEARRPQLPYDVAFAAAGIALRQARSASAQVQSSNEQFNDWLNRSVADLHMMVTDTPDGPYPYAGVPWFSTVFGRDGLITARQCLWLNPDLARGVLARLAATQAETLSPEQDAEPGKIVHEMRGGEMARLGEIPFGRYYGTVDATPLFVVLADAYWERTGDAAFLRRLWPHVERALGWMDEHGDLDGDGFVEYRRRSPNGLGNQGWKDSHDAIFHADGRLAQGPIALCEVQGYVYAAKRAAARLARVLGQPARAQALDEQGERLLARFEATFWDEELGTYVLALDGAKRPCRVRSSNAGHALFAGIAAPERAARVAATLLGDHFFTGWGVRTLAATEARYNPMSYHNGSVWPHDNALIALGLGRYQLKREVRAILAGLFDATLFLELHRLPELLCGFVRRPGEGPTIYPVACAPQAWAVGAVFMLLEACLGIAISAPARQVSFAYPTLPPFLEEVTIANLAVGDALVDLRLRRHGDDDVGVDVLRRCGTLEVVLRK
jgi:glycogen debranching enzyme